MYNFKEAGAVLPVLNSLLTCINTNDTYTTIHGVAFNLAKDAGICWHVHAYTKRSHDMYISQDFLQPVFIEMGLNREFPIEEQIATPENPAYRLYGANNDMYTGKVGELRKELLINLIQYFENILQKELA